MHLKGIKQLEILGFYCLDSETIYSHETYTKEPFTIFRYSYLIILNKIIKLKINFSIKNGNRKHCSI